MSKETTPRGFQNRSAVKAIVLSQPSQRQQAFAQQAHTPFLILDRRIPIAQSQPTTPRTPRTPRRSSSQNESNSQDCGSRQKSHIKGKSRNFITSPTVNKISRNVSPPNGTQPNSTEINTPVTAAYAGPTFHASPAPSALPIPSFYSKSTPDSPQFKGFKPLKDVQICTPPATVQRPRQLSKQESPLELFFKADREQKERAKSVASPLATSTNFQNIHPPNSPRFNQSTSYLRNNNSQYDCDLKIASSALLSLDLEEESDSIHTFENSTLTPYSERINAAKSENSRYKSSLQPPNIQKPVDRAEALKAYLFWGLLVPISPESSEASETSPR